MDVHGGAAWGASGVDLHLELLLGPLGKLIKYQRPYTACVHKRNELYTSK